METGNVYLILGSAGSGRREILIDLIQDGLSADVPVAVALAESEKPSESDALLTKRPATEILRYALLREVPPPPEGGVLFIVTPGDGDPADAIEAFQSWLKRSGAELARILSIIDCRLGAEEPALRDWFDCIVHFSDVVLLNRREGISPKWPNDFMKRYTDQFFPCILEYVKKGRVANPARVLDPVARRSALLFDDIDAVDQLDIDPDNLPEEPIDLVAPTDVWLERNDGGQRIQRLPDIRKYLTEL